MLKNNYITPQGFQKLIDEQDHLLKKERPEVTKVVTWAASLGDRSENADYQYGKKRLREIDRRLRFLKKRIESSQIVDPEKQNSSKVQFGATVIVDDGEKERKYAIVGADEIDTTKNYISWKSPIGSKLLGKEVGDSINVTTPRGEIELEIIEIRYLKLFD